MSRGRERLSVWKQAERDADLTVELPGAVPMLFRKIEKGSFRMGSRGAHPNEEPRHWVCIPEDFYLGSFVVTQKQWAAVAVACESLREMREPRGFTGARRPVERVGWEEAIRFCDWVNDLAPISGGAFGACLPSEAHWEYACRAGKDTDYYFGDDAAALEAVAWFDENADGRAQPVDAKEEGHPFGLYGMHGNVSELTADVFDWRAYRKRPDGWVARPWTSDDASDDAFYLSEEDRVKGSLVRVVRGGSWRNSAWVCRSAFRFGWHPDGRRRYYGFRVCLVRGPDE